MKEIEFQDALVELAHRFGWTVFHARPSGTGKGWRTAVAYDGKGYPDLTMIHPETGTVAFAELKAERGTASPDQQAWGEKLLRVQTMQARACRDEIDAPLTRYFYWKPSDANAIATFLSFGRLKEWAL